MKKIYSILLFFFCGIVGIKAQKVVPMPNVDAIVYCEEEDCFELYHKVGNNRFVRVFLFFDDEELKTEKNSFFELVTVEPYMDNKVQSLEDILEGNRKILYVKDLRPFTPDTYLNKTFEVKDGDKWYRREKKNRLVFKFLNRYIVAGQELYFGKHKATRGFSSGIISDDNSKKRWRIYDTDYYIPLVLDFGNNRRVFLITIEGNDIEYILLPMEHGDYMLSRKGICKLVETKKFESTRRDNFDRFWVERFFAPRPVADGKYELINTFAEKVLNAVYDTIVCEDRFLIAKDKDRVEVFNLYNHRLELGNIKNAYLCGIGYVEVLNEKGAGYYDEYGKEVFQLPRQYFAVCGTVPSWEYTLTGKKPSHRLIKRSWEAGSADCQTEEFLLTDRTADETVTFINGDTIYCENGNSEYIGARSLYPEYLKVAGNGRFGIVEYAYVQDSLTRPDTVVTNDDGWKTTETVFPPKSIVGRIVLPLVNDSITFGKDGLFYFHNEGKIGIFPRHTTVQYDEIKQHTRSFYHIVRDGRKGWLDIRTNWEYFEDLSQKALNDLETTLLKR